MATSTTRKSVLITGCSPGGIGHALCKEFHSKGLHVIATARRKETIADLEALGMSTVSLEVTSDESIAAAKIEVEALTGGRLDILVNNAGRNCTIPAIEVPLAEARACFDANFFGLIAVTQALTPLLLRTRGLVLNIGSVAAVIPYVFGGVYNASKAAVHAYSHALRLELAPYGVRVMVVVTGGVQSNIARARRALPPDSLYLPIEEEYRRRVTHSQEGAMPHAVYARGVVEAALRGRAKWLWRGNMAWTVWFLKTWVGEWVFDWVLPRRFGLNRLSALLKARGKA